MVTSSNNPAFIETSISENVFIREFSSETAEEFFYWHKDPEDRIIEPLEENDWKFQFDNELPQKIDKIIKIPEGVYHRVIQGTGILKLKLTKL